MLETLLGGLGGGLLRLAPEAMKFFDRKNERRHELALGSQQMELIKLQGQTRLDEARVQASSQESIAHLEALREAVKAQAAPTGIRWVDALSASVRPVLTYWIVAIWSLVKFASYQQLTAAGLTWDVAITTLWGPEDSALLAGVTTYWFVSRTLAGRS